jgi:hypothetical protein
MWLISSHNKLASDPKVMLSTGWIDNYFDSFLPHFSNLIRLSILGKDASDAVSGRENSFE